MGQVNSPQNEAPGSFFVWFTHFANIPYPFYIVKAFSTENFTFFKENSGHPALTGEKSYAILSVLVRLVQLKQGGDGMAMSMILALGGGVLLVGLLILLVAHLGK